MLYPEILWPFDAVWSQGPDPKWNIFLLLSMNIECWSVQNVQNISTAGVHLPCSSPKVKVFNSRGWEGSFHMLVTSITLSCLDHDLFLAICLVMPYPISTHISHDNRYMLLERKEYLPLLQAGWAATPVGCPGGCTLTRVEVKLQLGAFLSCQKWEETNGTMKWRCLLLALGVWFQALSWHRKKKKSTRAPERCWDCLCSASGLVPGATAWWPWHCWDIIYSK